MKEIWPNHLSKVTFLLQDLAGLKKKTWGSRGGVWPAASLYHRKPPFPPIMEVEKIGCSSKKSNYSSSHNHGSGEWVPTRLVSSTIGSVCTSMIMGGRVVTFSKFPAIYPTKKPKTWIYWEKRSHRNHLKWGFATNHWNFLELWGQGTSPSEEPANAKNFMTNLEDSVDSLMIFLWKKRPWVGWNIFLGKIKSLYIQEDSVG